MANRTIKRYNYHKWANTKVLDHLEQLPAEVYDRQIESVFPSISEVLAHIYQVDAMWLSVISGDTFEQTKKILVEIRQQLSDKSFGHMKELFAEIAGRYDAFLTGLLDLEKILHISHPQHGEFDVAVADLLEHVVNHGTYHRGNITAMLRQQGHKGVPTDYVFFLSSSGNS